MKKAKWRQSLGVAVTFGVAAAGLALFFRPATARVDRSLTPTPPVSAISTVSGASVAPATGTPAACAPKESPNDEAARLVALLATKVELTDAEKPKLVEIMSTRASKIKTAPGIPLPLGTETKVAEGEELGDGARADVDARQQLKTLLGDERAKRFYRLYFSSRRVNRPAGAAPPSTPPT